MKARIVVLAGDGIGPEVTAQAVRVLDAVGARFDLELEFENALLGGIAYDELGSPLPAVTLEACKRSTAVLLGAVGGANWANGPGDLRPEQGLLGLR